MILGFPLLDERRRFLIGIGVREVVRNPAERTEQVGDSGRARDELFIACPELLGLIKGLLIRAEQAEDAPKRRRGEGREPFRLLSDLTAGVKSFGVALRFRRGVRVVICHRETIGGWGDGLPDRCRAESLTVRQDSRPSPTIEFFRDNR